ncbi:MAG: hypothetical protein Q8R98_01845 [Rubrivivax sp.]|nr:hypothetical protein [Rubrivivax sp.]MDP3610573.1 hypothetical protein [Rubrivivax sp.]
MKPIPTKRFNWPAWLWPTNAVAAVIALYGLVAHLDNLDDIERANRASELAQARYDAFHEGRQAGEAKMIDTARAAWQAAITEGEFRCAQGKQVRQ